MQCPYCLSEVEGEAHVCKVCTRDLYLFKPLLEKIATLEEQLAAAADVDLLEERIRSLEQQLEDVQAKPETQEQPGVASYLLALVAFILLPLSLLLLAHWLITVLYDAPLIYLRIISIVLPLPFGYFLFARRKRSVVPWFAGTCVLAISSVIGMSWITSLVDHTPILPQNAFEWREYLEYAASISFSFLTGMLIGGIVHTRRNRPPVRASRRQTGTSSRSERVQKIIELVNEHGSSVVALGSTVASVYTGLQEFMGGGGG